MRGVHTLIGPPGTGKTTRVSEIVREVYHEELGSGNPAIVVSLTKAAAAEAAGRSMPISAKCVGTLHSFAYRALECPEIAESRAQDFGSDFPAWAFESSSTDPDEPAWERSSSRGKSKSDGMLCYETIQELRARRIPRESPVWAGVRDFDRSWESWKEENELLDFTDLIERTLDTVPACPLEPSVIVADEAQDLSALELALLRSWTVNGAEGLVLVGDPLQALYEWRGAHPELFADKRVAEANRTVLSRSYRVPSAVHRVACSWAGELLSRFRVSYLPREGEEGSFGFLDASWRSPSSSIEWALDRLGSGSVMLQASCSYMLAPILAELRSRAIPFANPWRRRRGDWNPLARNSRLGALLLRSPERLWTAKELASWLHHFEAKKGLRRGAKTAIKRLVRSEDPLDFEPLLDWFEPETLDGLMSRLDDPKALAAWWFDRLSVSGKRTARYGVEVVRRHGIDSLREEPKLFVGTSHSFKGAEADSVLVFPDLSPLGWAELQGGGKGAEAVTRLGYVALTRAKRECWIARANSRMAMDLS